MSTSNPKPLTQDEVATSIRKQLKSLSDKTLSPEEKNLTLYSISTLTDLYAKVSVSQ